MFAFLPTLGFQELFVLFVLGILLFGRNLPDVGRKVGRTVNQLRRSMSEFRAQMDRDESVKEMRNTIRDARDELRRADAIPRAIVDPAAAARDFANQTVRDAFNNGDDGQAAARGTHEPHNTEGSEQESTDSEAERKSEGQASPGS